MPLLLPWLANHMLKAELIEIISKWLTPPKAEYLRGFGQFGIFYFDQID